jgi:UDP-N-acetylglucosamine kinase
MRQIAHAKPHRKAFSKQFTAPEIYIPEENPVSVFMAGSPGAGKTEASLELLARIVNGSSVLRIDPDDLRTAFEDYNGANAYLFQRAVSILVDCILDRAFRKNQSFILDGTLSSYESAKKNIDRSLDKKRMVQILYVYQLPNLALSLIHI